MDSNSLFNDVAPENTFYLFNCIPIKNLVELVSALEPINPDDFAVHCNKDKDDFAAWISGSLGLTELATSLKNITNKDQYIDIIKTKLYPSAPRTALQETKQSETKTISQETKKEAKTTSAAEKKTAPESKINSALSAAPKKIEPVKAPEKIPESNSREERLKLNKQIEKTVQSMLAKELAAHLANINKKMDKIFEARIEKLEKSFDKKTETASSAKLAKFRNEINQEKHNLRAISADTMQKEFEKVFNNDEHLNKIVSKYQTMFTEDVENTEKLHKEHTVQFNDELNALKNNAVLNSQAALNTQLTETIRKQREILDTELAKTLSSNKYFFDKFEKEAIDREKLFQESADRKLKESYNLNENMLHAKFDEYNQKLLDLKMQMDKTFKLGEAQMSDLIKTKICEEMDKEFADILVNQRDELSESISAARSAAVNKINTDFNELISKHKQFIIEQSAKTDAEQNALKTKFIDELKSEEDSSLLKVKELLKKEVSATIIDQREFLDKELAKTVLANKYFVERFEKEIREMTKKLTSAGDKIFEDNYAKHRKLLQDAHDKQFDSIKKLISSANTNFTSRTAEIYTDLNSTIPPAVREAVNREFKNLIINEKQALEAELRKAEEVNKTIEKKFEEAVQAKAQELISALSKETSENFNTILAAQQAKIDQEITRAKNANDAIENKKNEILEKSDSIIENIGTSSASKLKEMESEYSKHLKKVSQLTTLITRAENVLNDVKALRTEVSNDKKNISRENAEYTQLISELTDLRNELAEEKNRIETQKNQIEAHSAKADIYSLMQKCSNYIKLKDVNNAKSTYNKIAELYSHTTFEKDEKTEIFNAAVALAKDIQGMNTPKN